MRELILASATPRRREILTQIELPFSVVVSDVEEHLPDAPPVEIVQSLARQKAEAVAGRHPEALILGADTIVVLDGQIMGKPKDRADAKKMIERLQGRSHEVYTGVAVCCPETGCFMFAERTVVTVQPVEEQEIEAYLDTKEPYDKAGAYAVQGIFARYIKELKGDFYNVMGLPASRIYQELKQRGLLF